MIVALFCRKIIEIFATKCHILNIKCTKFDFGWGSTQDPDGGAYSAPTDPLVVFKGFTSTGRKGGEKTGRKGGEIKKMVGKDRRRG